MFSTEKRKQIKKREDTKNEIENPIVNKKLADMPITMEREPSFLRETVKDRNSKEDQRMPENGFLIF